MPAFLVLERARSLIDTHGSSQEISRKMFSKWQVPIQWKAGGACPTGLGCHGHRLLLASRRQADLFVRVWIGFSCVRVALAIASANGQQRWPSHRLLSQP